MPRPYIIRDGDGGTVLAPQRAQVQHAAIRCPQECVGDWEPAGVAVSRLARPHDAAEVVDGVGAAGPTTEPFSFRSWAMLVAPPRVPRSIIVPGSTMAKACFAGATAPRLCPATWPRRLTASASLSFPPSVPRSKLVPADSR